MTHDRIRRPDRRRFEGVVTFVSDVKVQGHA